MPTKFNIKKITGLPLTFTGQAGKVKFRVVRQLDMYGNINASIEDIESGKYIVSADGKISADNLADAFVKYVKKIDPYQDEKDLKGRMKKFFTQINKDVKDEQKKGIKIKKAPIKKAVYKKAAKKSNTKKITTYQYGKSNLQRDKQRQALAPGKRKSASGRTYYEYRANRSDAGQLLGTKTHKDTKSHNVNIRVVSGVEKLSKSAQKLWQDINKKGLFKYNTEENILKLLYDEAIRKGQYRKATLLKQLINDVTYY